VGLLKSDLSPVYTGNNVEATGNKVASCFDIVAGVDRALDKSGLVGFRFKISF